MALTFVPDANDDGNAAVSACRRGAQMFQTAQLEIARLEHNHDGDGWHEMVDATPLHGSALTDQERDWPLGRIFRCAACDSEIRVVLADPSPVEHAVTAWADLTH